jgi:hypothetical protein
MKKIIIVLALLICAFLGYFLHNYNNGWETDFPLNKKAVKASNSKLVWIDYVIGGPPNAGQFDGIDTLIKKWKLNYKRIEVGCEVDNTVLLNEKKYKLNNLLYFRSLESVYGKDWKQKFDKELHQLDSLNWQKYQDFK